jgi:outer membrane protease
MIIKRGYYLADSRQYTGYVYTGTSWEAMGGNYSADNVILPEDI